MISVTIEFLSGETETIMCVDAVHTMNGMEKLVIDDEVEVAYPVHRIRKIIYEKE